MISSFFLQELNLIDIPSSNGLFTLFRGQSKSKLDRLINSPSMPHLFRSIRVMLLKRSVLDHCPILVQPKLNNWGPRPLRFLKCWLTHPGCMEKIKDPWEKSANLSFVEKLKQVKMNLKDWNSFVFEVIDTKLSFLESRIHEYDNIANTRVLESHEIEERKSAQLELWEWLRRKESFWAQNSRAKWIREGDKNKRNFHSLASIQSRRNCTESLISNGRIIESPDEIKLGAKAFLNNLFFEAHQTRPTFNGLNFQQLGEEQGQFLTTYFSHEEIDAVVASCDSSKSPGPDGFNFRCIKESWDVIKQDVYGIIHEFWNSSRLPNMPVTPSLFSFQSSSTWQI